MASKQVVHTSFFSRPAKYSPFSAGLIVPPGCGLLFTPGMTARGADGETMHGGDVTAQTRRVLEQLQAVVTEAGATMDDVVKLTVFIMEMSDAVPIQAVRNEFWPRIRPSRRRCRWRRWSTTRFASRSRRSRCFSQRPAREVPRRGEAWRLTCR